MKRLFFVFFLFLFCTSSLIAQEPNLRYVKVLRDPNQSIYNPTGEFIFPNVIQATDHIASPLGKYYMYYAPHDAPGGVCLAYSNNIEGPYTEYANNPIISNTHQGKINVTHVSSPYVVWMPQYNKYFCYFHGENTTTRWAYSTDGITWDLANENTAITASAFGYYNECSYAKVYEYTIPAYGNRYFMIMMLFDGSTGRKIGLATSSDGKVFTPRNDNFINTNAETGNDIAAPFYWPYNGQHYIIYHGSSGNIHYSEVGSNFNYQNYMGIFYDPAPYAPELDKAASCNLYYVNDRWYMIYDVGIRLQQSIGLAMEIKNFDIVVDNNSPYFTYSGSWVSSTSTAGYYGSDYMHDNNAGTNTGEWAKWKPDFPYAGTYRVLARWPAYTNRPDNIKYKVYHQGIVSEAWRNQQINRASWVDLGTFNFDSGTSESNMVTIDAGSDDGYTIADAVWFICEDINNVATPRHLRVKNGPTFRR